MGVTNWTKHLLPSVVRWIERPPSSPLTFHLTQVLSEHEAFGEYLHRFGLLGSPECSHCGSHMDDVKHTVFDCPHWADARTQLSALVGHQIHPKDVEGLLCGSDRQDLRPSATSEFKAARRAFFISFHIRKGGGRTCPAAGSQGDSRGLFYNHGYNSEGSSLHTTYYNCVLLVYP